VALDQRDDELDDVLSANLLQRGVSRGPPRAMTHQDALLQNIRNSACPVVSAVSKAERHTRTSQVKALPPEVVSVSPARRGFPLTSVMRPTSVASEADMKPGNRKGTNPGPPDRTRRTRRTAIVLRTPPRVLSSTAANCGPPFGTKRPQVQILSPRPVFPQVRGPHQNWWGPRLLPVQQQNAASTATSPNIDLLIEGAPPSLRRASLVAIGLAFE